MNAQLLCLLGPTAVGKTEIAIHLARRLNAEIISVDSRQIYRELDIGTAKPTPAEQRAVRHHLIDCVDISEAFSVAAYQSLADRAIADIQKRGKRVLLVGGAGLYFRAVVDGLFEGPGGDPGLRRRFEQEATETLHRQLTACDPVLAARIHPNNRVRVIRALEVYELTGTPLSERQRQWDSGTPRYPFLAFCLTLPRPRLYHRIEQRVDSMLASGLMREVESLLAAGHPRESAALRSFGYKELIAYLDGTCSYTAAVSALKQNTRRFAKRQLTWFRKDSRLIWVDRKATAESVGYLLERIADTEETPEPRASVPGEGRP